MAQGKDFDPWMIDYYRLEMKRRRFSDPRDRGDRGLHAYIGDSIAQTIDPRDPRTTDPFPINMRQYRIGPILITVNSEKWWAHIQEVDKLTRLLCDEALIDYGMRTVIPAIEALLPREIMALGPELARNPKMVAIEVYSHEAMRGRAATILSGTRALNRYLIAQEDRK